VCLGVDGVQTAILGTSVRLLTNNPAKAEALRDGGLEVTMSPLETLTRSEDERYLMVRAGVVDVAWLPARGCVDISDGLTSSASTCPIRSRFVRRYRTALGLSAPDLSGLDGSGLKVAVVAAQWHGTVMGQGGAGHRQLEGSWHSDDGRVAYSGIDQPGDQP
jgi:hypothetical protein